MPVMLEHIQSIFNAHWPNIRYDENQKKKENVAIRLICTSMEYWSEPNIKRPTNQHVRVDIFPSHRMRYYYYGIKCSIFIKISTIFFYSLS